MNKVFIINNICYEKYRFENALKKFPLFVEKGTIERWAMSTLRNPGNIFCPSPVLGTVVQYYWQSIWIHVWDDSPFSGEIFERKLGMCNLQKNFFVLYGNTRFNSKRSLDELIQSKFGKFYPDVESRNHHVFVVNSDTNEGMDKLAEAVRKEMLC